MARNFAAKAVHKYMYPGTYNFRDEADGTSGTSIGFVDSATLYDGACVIIASLDGHKKVMQMTDDATAAEDPNITHNLTQATSGIIEWWIRTDSTSIYSIWRFQQAGSTIVRFRLTGNDWQYYDGGVWQDIITVYTVDTWYHMRFIWRADNTFDFYVDGVKEVNNQATENNQVGGIDNFDIYILSDSTDSVFLDAWGESSDTDYAIGDNVFWRHYKESEADTFEEDDTGTQGTSITWVDTVDTAASVEIVQEFNEHKKILRQDYSSAVGGYDYNSHTFLTQSTSGWYSCWVKVIDANADNRFIYLQDAGVNNKVQLRIESDKFQHYTAGAWADTGLAAVDATWYFVYVQWYADDTHDIWIDNIQYKDAVATANVIGAGPDTALILAFGAGKYIYVDSPMSSLDSDERGDNRIFDYNDAYTREDITTATQNVIYSNVLHGWRTATLYSKNDYDHDRVFLQIYDINSKLALEAEIINRVQKSEIRTYTLLDKNYDDLASLSSNTFSADDLHDPTDSTSMLKTVLPNVSEIDGDLILVTADTKTDTYSTVTKNYPDGDFLRDISDLSDSCVIIEANGKCHLDDDLASGDSLDFDNAADHSKMTGEPKVNDILDTINYFEIFGAINPDTGERFYKITDNSGDDRKRKWRITNNSFRNQTDLDAYAVKLVAKLISVKEITINVQGFGAHNMGTLFTYKYDNDIYTIPTAAYYVISESIDFDTAAATILLSEGIIEGSKYSAGFERPQNYSDTDQGQIYETDIITVYPESYPYGGATKGDGAYITANAVGEGIRLYFSIPDQVDDGRNAYFHFYWQRGDANNDTVTCLLYASSIKTDGSEAITNNVEDGTGITLAASVAGARYQTYVYTLAAADFASGDYVSFAIDIREVRTLYLLQPAIVFYLKRSV